MTRQRPHTGVRSMDAVNTNQMRKSGVHANTAIVLRKCVFLFLDCPDCLRCSLSCLICSSPCHHRRMRRAARRSEAMIEKDTLLTALITFMMAPDLRYPTATVTVLAMTPDLNNPSRGARNRGAASRGVSRYKGFDVFHASCRTKLRLLMSVLALHRYVSRAKFEVRDTNLLTAHLFVGCGSTDIVHSGLTHVVFQISHWLSFITISRLLIVFTHKVNLMGLLGVFSSCTSPLEPAIHTCTPEGKPHALVPRKLERVAYCARRDI